MPTWEAMGWIAAVAAALAAGLMGATTGGGGGLVILPALYLLGLAPVHALANTRLLFFLAAVASVLAYARAGRVRWRLLPPLTGAAAVGALAGTWLVPELPARVPKILLAAMAILLVLVKLPTPRAEGSPDGHARAPLLPLVAMGLGAGAVASMIGGGAGMVLAAALISFGWTALEAVAAAQVTVVASNLVAFGSYAATGAVDFPLALALAGAGMAGAFVGARHLAGLPKERAERVVRGTLVIVAAVALLDAVLG